LDFKYVAFGSDTIQPIVAAVRTLGVRGLGVSMPHKISVIEHLDEISEAVKAIGACNTVVNASGKRYVQLPEGTHHVMLEKNRLMLFEAVQAFLDEAGRS